MGKIIRSEAWVLRNQLCSNFQISVKLPPLPTTHGHPESVVSGPTTPADKPAGAFTGPPQRASAAACVARPLALSGRVRISKKCRGGGERVMVTFGHGRGPKRGAAAQVVVLVVLSKLRKERFWKDFEEK
jgi:hypothetical protein